MSEAREIELAVADRVGDLDLVMIGANDPDAMVRHTEECRALGIPVRRRPLPAARPDGRRDVAELIDGAAYLFTNEYEWGCCGRRPACPTTRSLARVGVRVTTLGAKASRSSTATASPSRVDAVPGEREGRPDRCRRRVPGRIPTRLHARPDAGAGGAARVADRGAVLETVGTQEWTLERDSALKRLADAYGTVAAEEIGAVCL